MATATKTSKAFKVCCIRCGAEDAVTIGLHDPETFHCTDCSEEWTADDVRAMLAGWERVLAWVALAPVQD